MPLLGVGECRSAAAYPSEESLFLEPHPTRAQPTRRQSQHSIVAKAALKNFTALQSTEDRAGKGSDVAKEHVFCNSIPNGNYRALLGEGHKGSQPTPKSNGVGSALSDTPQSTAPNSPNMSPRLSARTSPSIAPIHKDSGASTPSNRTRPATLDIPGLTKSRVSPDGRIASRDVGSKLVIVMVGLPARGKSYVTKKIARYLNWSQHDTRIFNVGNRRREVTGGTCRPVSPKPQGAVSNSTLLDGIFNCQISRAPEDSSTLQVLSEGDTQHKGLADHVLPPPALAPGPLADPSVNGLGRDERNFSTSMPGSDYFAAQTETSDAMEQNAEFFDPNNARASMIREKVAMETLDELLDFILLQGGSVGIFDATNSTLKRRKAIVDRIRQRAGPELGVLFLESLCVDENLLESNMRLKLSGPDYKDQDPVVALADFKKRVAMYEKSYVPLGDYEEKHNMQYVQMIDVGRKFVSHQIKGFLSAQTVYYLLNFNLAPRQIWITRHGESFDDKDGKIGGDSDLSAYGQAYSIALAKFIQHERRVWEVRQHDKALSTHFPPQPGDTTPPNPQYSSQASSNGDLSTKPFCVWTSMLKRSIQTAEFFNEDDFEVKQMRMLDELNAGTMEGMTYEQIKRKFPSEYERRKRDKLHYRYPGAGGEGYLDVIHRLRAVIVEIERMTDHVLLVGHRSVARVLLAYFLGLKREDVANLDVPLGMLYVLEPKPYGVEFRAFRYDAASDWFDEVPGYQLKPAEGH